VAGGAKLPKVALPNPWPCRVRARAARRIPSQGPKKDTLMASTVKKIPAGYTAVTPYLTVKGAAQAIEFYKKAFGAEEVMRFPSPDGKIMHAEIRIGGAVIMLHDEAPQWNALSPQTVGDTSSSIMLYVNDVDAVMKKAADAGATVTMPAADQFYGDRCGNVKDPFGHKWSIATHIEDVAPEELKKRMAKMFEQKG
jgi:PhnB protein